MQASLAPGLHRNLIIALAARHRLPAVCSSRSFISGGGLLSYGPVTIELWRGAAGYVDRILRGKKPADLPVQAPTKYEMVLNMKTAKALGLAVPQSILVRADEVIKTAGVHCGAWWRGSCVAARGPRAAGGDASGGVSRRGRARGVCK
jgi:putative ABC transport system substrate-binding protein